MCVTQITQFTASGGKLVSVGFHSPFRKVTPQREKEFPLLCSRFLANNDNDTATETSGDISQYLGCWTWHHRRPCVALRLETSLICHYLIKKIGSIIASSDGNGEFSFFLVYMYVCMYVWAKGRESLEVCWRQWPRTAGVWVQRQWSRLQRQKRVHSAYIKWFAYNGVFHFSCAAYTRSGPASRKEAFVGNMDMHNWTESTAVPGCPVEGHCTFSVWFESNAEDRITQRQCNATDRSNGWKCQSSGSTLCACNVLLGAVSQSKNEGFKIRFVVVGLSESIESF